MSDKNNKKTPAEIEKSKTEKQRAEDIAYTLNHTIVCTATDFIDPYIGNSIQKHLGNKSQLANCWIAEIIGDFGAVPMTIGMQRLFPNIMSDLGKFLEPAFKGAFQNGARRDAKIWAQKKGIDIDSNEYKNRVKEIYQYEVVHLPQALMWTCSSVVLNVASQRAMGNKAPITHITAGKAGGAALTAGLTVGGRSIFPQKAEKLDGFISKNILLPMEEKIEKRLGLEHEEDEKKEQKNTTSNWSNRVKISKKDRESTLDI